MGVRAVVDGIALEIPAKVVVDATGQSAILSRQLKLRETDDKLKNAPRLSSIYRHLADRWEARGEFRRARELLETAREELQSALPIPAWMPSRKACR